MKPLYWVYCSTPIFWRSSIQRYLEEGAWTPICCWHQNELLPQAIQHTIGLAPHGVGCSVITSEQVCIECFLVLTHWDTNAVIDLWQPVTCTKTRHWPWTHAAGEASRRLHRGTCWGRCPAQSWPQQRHHACAGHWPPHGRSWAVVMGDTQRGLCL